MGKVHVSQAYILGHKHTFEVDAQRVVTIRLLRSKLYQRIVSMRAVYGGDSIRRDREAVYAGVYVHGSCVRGSSVRGVDWVGARGERLSGWYRLYPRHCKQWWVLYTLTPTLCSLTPSYTHITDSYTDARLGYTFSHRHTPTLHPFAPNHTLLHPDNILLH